MFAAAQTPGYCLLGPLAWSRLTVGLRDKLLSRVLRGYCHLRPAWMFAAAQTPRFCLLGPLGLRRDRKEEIKTFLIWAREARISVPGIGMFPGTPSELKNK